jgi:hypothetical protein
MSRPIFTDPEPLPPDAPPFVDDFSRDGYAGAVERAVDRMSQFDRLPPERRAGEWQDPFPGFRVKPRRRRYLG